MEKSQRAVKSFFAYIKAVELRFSQETDTYRSLRFSRRCNGILRKSGRAEKYKEEKIPPAKTHLLLCSVFYFYFKYLLSHSKNTRCHITEFCGLETQCPSS